MKFKHTLVALILVATTSVVAMEDIKVSGSLRYRAERIDKRGSDLINRHRVQAKLQALRKINKYFKGTIGLASGSTEPTSTNQTLDNGFTTKSINLDTAVIDSNFKGQNLKFGKMKNPLYKPGKSQLIWDGDLRPEGVHGNFNYNIKETALTLNLGQFWIEEKSSSEEVYLSTAQLLVSHKFKPLKVTLGAGVISYDNLKGETTLGDSSDSLGNTATCTTSGSTTTCAYDQNYKLTNFFVELKLKLANLPFTLYYDMVSNSKVSVDDKASAIGLKIGKAKKKGSWQFSYVNKKLEKDAVVAGLTDSDFKGAGTDGKGHKIAVAYALMDDTTLGLTHFINETSLTQSATKDYDRTQDRKSVV